MSELWIYGGAFLVSVLGIGLFRLAAHELEEPLQRVVCVLMVLCNLALTMVWKVLYGLPPMQILKYLALAAVLCVCAWTDWKKYLILNRVLALALTARAVLFAAELLLYGMEQWKFVALSALIAAGMFAVAGLLCKAVMPQGVGFGDIKLLFTLGLYTGADPGISIMFCTLLVMFVVSVILLLARKVTRKSVIPFAPFLYGGMLLASFLFGM